MSWKSVALCVVASCALSIATIWMARSASGVDSDALVRASLTMASAQRSSPPSEEQVAAASRFMGPMMRAYPLLAIIGTVVWLVGMTTIFFIALKMIDGAPSWTTVLGAVAIATLCQTAAGFLLTGAAVASQAPTASELVSGTFITTNAAKMLPEDSAAPLIAFVRRFDVLTLIFLIVFGVTIADRMPPKVSRGAIAGVIAACFALWVVIAVAGAFIMPSMVMR